MRSWRAYTMRLISANVPSRAADGYRLRGKLSDRGSLARHGGRKARRMQDVLHRPRVRRTAAADVRLSRALVARGRQHHPASGGVTMSAMLETLRVRIFAD